MKVKILMIMTMTILSLFGATCAAMTMGEPEEFGEIGHARAGLAGGGVTVSGYTKIYDYKYFTKIHANNTNSYEKFTALFPETTGNAIIKLMRKPKMVKNYMSYDEYCTLGAKSTKNTMNLESFSKLAMYTLPNDIGYHLYMLQELNGDPWDLPYTLIGLRPDGKFVKFFDTDKNLEDYFGGSNGLYAMHCGPSAPIIDGNTIVFPIITMGKNGRNKIGELKYTWSEDTQWFGVEYEAY